MFFKKTFSNIFKEIMNTTLIMSSIHLGNENVVIDNTETISPTDQGQEIDIRDIDMIILKTYRVSTHNYVLMRKK